MRPKKVLRYALIVTAVLAYFTAVLYLRVEMQSQSNNPSLAATIQHQPTKTPPTPCPTVVYHSQKELAFLSELRITDPAIEQSMLLSFNDVAVFKNQFAIDEEIISVAYSPTRNQVLYLAGPKDYSREGLRKVELFDIATKTNKVIFSYETKQYEGDTMFANVDILRSISLSPDESKVMIITDKELFLYDLDSESFIFSSDGTTNSPIFRDEQGNRHFFNTAVISPDSQRAVLSYGYYEGVSYYLLDFSTGNITSLEKGGYAEGSFVEGWVNDQIVYYQFGGNQNLEPQLCTEAIDGTGVNCFNVNENLFNKKKIVPIGDDIYVLAKRYDTAVTYEGCNNAGRTFTFNTAYDSLVRANMDTRSEEELLYVDATQVSGSILNSAIVSFVPYSFQGSQQILLKLNDENNNTIYALLDPNVPEKLTKLVF